MKNILESKQVGNYVIEISNDDYPESPRNWSNLGRMICFHKRYSLGDFHDYNHEDYNSWEELKEAIIENEKAVIIFPLYLYDHSGITISTSNFNDRWDSGQVGFVYCTQKDIDNCYMEPEVDNLDRAEKCIQDEVKTYDQYLRGDVYEYSIYKLEQCSLGHTHKELIHSCSGFYDMEHCIDDAMSNTEVEA